jgi:hypothetical protein
VEGEPAAVKGLAFKAKIEAVGEVTKVIGQRENGLSLGIGTDAGVPVEGALTLGFVSRSSVEGLRLLPAEWQEGDGGLPFQLLLLQHLLVEVPEFKEDYGDIVV